MKLTGVGKGGVSKPTASLNLVAVESYVDPNRSWFQFRFGKLVLVHIRFWNDEGAPEWELYWPGLDCYRVDSPKFSDMEAAATWFYNNYIREDR